MKHILILTIFFSICACKKDDSKPSLLHKTWNFSYKTRQKDKDGNFGPWLTINTLVAVMPIEFKPNGDYLVAGKKSISCCDFGRYTIKNNIINLFSGSETGCELVACPLPCNIFEIKTITKDSLVLESCSTQNLWLANK